MTLCMNCQMPGCDSHECWKCCRLFVYGTLKKGRSNHRLMAGAQFIGEAISEQAHYVLAHICLKEEPGPFASHVCGELYIVPSLKQWRALDRLEGHPHNWKRERREFRNEAGNLFDAWVYIFQGEVSSDRLCVNRDGYYEF